MLDTFSISAVVSDKFPWLSWLVELVDMLLCKIFWLKFNPKSVNRLQDTGNKKICHIICWWLMKIYPQTSIVNLYFVIALVCRRRRASYLSVELKDSALSRRVIGTPLALFLLLFESSHVCPVNVCEIKSFLLNQSVWEAR